MRKHKIGNELTEIPYVGGSVAKDFIRIGITKVADLKGKSPEELYPRFATLKENKWIAAFFMFAGLLFILLKIKILTLKNSSGGIGKTNFHKYN